MIQDTKTKQDIKPRQEIKTRVYRWGTLLLTSVMLAGSLAMLPMPTQAATTSPVAVAAGWGPGHMWGRGGPMLSAFWVTGEVTEVGEASITLELPNHEHARGMMRNISVEVTLAVDESSILLDNALSSLTLATLQVGDAVVIVPRLVWGELTTRLLYVGTPEDLSDASYMGRFVEADGDTLTLENRHEGEFAVLVDANTIWYDEGRVERPAELSEETSLRVLGVEEEDEEGDTVIRAVLVTPLGGL